MGDVHEATVEQQFTHQAAAFEDQRFVGALAQAGGWIFEGLERRPTDLVLDVAAGTGHAARALAPGAAAVIALDATAAMLEQGRAAAEREGLTNVVFQRGDAAALPFVDGSFDLVVTRFALHHMESASAVVAEMARCLRPGGGRLVLADLITDDDHEIAARHDALEVARDPSHTRCLSAPELGRLAEQAGLRVTRTRHHEMRRPLQPWLEQTATTPAAAAEIRAALEAELAGGPPTGLAPQRAGRDGGDTTAELTFCQRFAAVHAVLT